MTPKVSVIVPMYNVEQYLNRCILSIQNQSYKNLEIILINDGSPDKCGQIAMEYQKKDKRIKVIHKENGGLSDARNEGMKLVTGEFTFFVDSDDWLDVNCIQILVSESLNSNADIVQCSFFYAYQTELLLDERYFKQTDDSIILNRLKVMEELVVNERVKNFAWGKLYKTELIKDIPFKKGVLFEDVFWAHHVINRVSVYKILHTPLYYYLQRPDSIVSSYSIKNLDILKGLQERHQYISENYPELLPYSFKTLFKTSLVHYYLLMRNRKLDLNKKHRKEIIKIIRKNYRGIIESCKLDLSLTIQVILFTISPILNAIFLLSQNYLRRIKLFKQPKKLTRISIEQ